MSRMNIIGAVNSALDVEMARDENMIIMGEDIGRFGGVFRATDGLLDKYGEARVIDTPLSEAGIIGTAIGMGLYGMTVVPEIQFSDFIFPAYDQIVNELAKMRYRSGGEYPCPITIRTPYGGGIKGGHYHSQSSESLFTHIAGLKVVIPSTPYDTKGLLLSAIRDPDPVIFMEPKRIYRGPSMTSNWNSHPKGEVPDGDYTVPLGKAEVVTEGDDVTLLAYGSMLQWNVDVVKQAADAGISVELVDLRTLVPLDEETIVKSLQKTGRVVIVHEAPKTSGFGAELIAMINEKCFYDLQAAPVRVTGYDTPFPYALEFEYLPSVKRIMAGISKVMEG